MKIKFQRKVDLLSGYATLYPNSYIRVWHWVSVQYWRYLKALLILWCSSAIVCLCVSAVWCHNCLSHLFSNYGCFHFKQKCQWIHFLRSVKKISIDSKNKPLDDEKRGHLNQCLRNVSANIFREKTIYTK